MSELNGRTVWVRAGDVDGALTEGRVVRATRDLRDWCFRADDGGQPVPAGALLRIGEPRPWGAMACEHAAERTELLAAALDLQVDGLFEVVHVDNGYDEAECGASGPVGGDLRADGTPYCDLCLDARREVRAARGGAGDGRARGGRAVRGGAVRDNTKLQAEAEKLGLRIELETTWIPGGRVARVVYRGDKRRYRGTADEVRTFLARCAAKALRAARERSYVETQPLANLPTDRAAREAWGLTAD